MWRKCILPRVGLGHDIFDSIIDASVQTFNQLSDVLLEIKEVPPHNVVKMDGHFKWVINFRNLFS